MRKLKILAASEASFLKSGFGVYYNEILKRLHATGKYDIAEHASYGGLLDNKAKGIPWRYYANAVSKSDSRYEEFLRRPRNAFGEWRWEKVCLHFKPDIVWSIRDPWMDSHLFTSPLRPYYHLVTMPTVDSEPLKNEWIEDYISADGIFTYSTFGTEVLRKQSGGKINLLGEAYPGADLSIFKPVEDKKAHKKRLGFDPDSFIIGTVMRNQKRKLFPDLFEAFSLFLKTAPKEIASRTFLYIHTSWPDMGWDIPSLIVEHGLTNKIICTYICQKTNKPFMSFFQDGKTYSPHSNGATGVLPRVSSGLTTKNMAETFNIFDLYVQYAICEGFGMPQVEAAACGVPVAAVDYSAMEDVVRKLEGFPIRVQRKFRELETNAYRAYPDNNHLVEIMLDFFNKTDKERATLSSIARERAEKYFNWDSMVKKWENYFDNADLSNKKQWNSPPQLYNIPTQIPPNMSNKDFVKWLFYEVVKEPKKMNSYKSLLLLRDLNYAATVTGGKAKPFTQQEAFEGFRTYAVNKMHCEQCRVGMLHMTDEDYLSYSVLT